MQRGTGYTPRGRGGFTSRGGYTPRGRGGYTPRGRGGYTPEGDSRQRYERDNSEGREEDGLNKPRYENDEVRPGRTYEQKTRANPYRRIGPARKHPLPPPTKMAEPEV